MAKSKHHHPRAPQRPAPPEGAGTQRQASSLLSWLMAICPTGRKNILGVELVEREPLPKGQRERYFWGYATRAELEESYLFRGALGERHGAVLPVNQPVPRLRAPAAAGRG